MSVYAVLLKLVFERQQTEKNEEAANPLLDALRRPPSLFGSLIFRSMLGQS